MKEILDTIVVGKYTLQDLLIAVGGVVAFLILVRIIMRVFRKKDIDQHFQFVTCSSCGWQGNVSKYAGHCPKCNQPLGERKIQRKT